MLPESLIAGFERFHTERFVREESAYRALADDGQRPTTFVISCCDSRVSPEVIFDTNPGDIFVMRNIANIVPPFELSGQYHGTSAALDFAVRRLEVQHLVVLGHSNCGGVRAYVEDSSGVSNGEFLGPWLRLIGAVPGVVAPDGSYDDLREIEYKSVQNSLENLRTFPWISARCDAGTLRLHEAHFDVGAGTLRWFDADSGEWRVQAKRQISRDPAGAASPLQARGTKSPTMVRERT